MAQLRSTSTFFLCLLKNFLAEWCIYAVKFKVELGDDIPVIFDRFLTFCRGVIYRIFILWSVLEFKLSDSFFIYAIW